MTSFKQFYNQSLDEALIGLGNKKYGQIVVTVGASGSGKSLVSKFLLNLPNLRVIDVDHMKQMAIKSPLLQNRYPKLKNIDFKNPEDVKYVHDVVNKKEELDVKVLSALKKSVQMSTSKEKTNFLFDVTLKEIGKLKEIFDFANSLGYDKDSIHIIWVLTPLEKALEQNLKRSRVVPEEIVKTIHFAVANTMREVIRNQEVSRQYADGYVYVMFNLAGIDTLIRTSDKGGKFIEKATYVKLKEPGKHLEAEKVLTQEVLEKIKKYIPTSEF